MPHRSYRTCLGLLALLVTSTFIPRASPAQFLDPDTKLFCWHCNSHNSHFIGGVGLELADYVQCRQTHSCGREDAGFGFVDLGYDVAGAVATELLIAGLKHVPGLKRLL